MQEMRAQNSNSITIYTLQGGDPVVTPTFGIILRNFTSYQFHYTFCCYAHQNIFVMCGTTKLKHLGPWAICFPDSTFATVLVVHLVVLAYWSLVSKRAHK